MRKRTAAAVVLIAALVVAAAAAARSVHSAGPTKLTVWAGWSAGHELKVFKSVVAEYDRKHPEVTIDVVGGIDDNKIVAAIRSGTAPDVVSSFNSYNVGNYCGSGGWIDLGPLMKKDNIDASMFPPAPRYYTQYQGKRCALPLLADDYGLYYNKKLFKAAGIARPPRTLSELAADAKKLTVRDKSGKIKVAGFDPVVGFYENTPDRWIQSYGAKWLDAKGNSAIGSDGGWAKWAKWMKKLIDWYGYDKLVRFQAQPIDEFTPSQAFETGKLAMNFDGEWRVAFIHNEHPDLDYGTAPMPVDDAHPELYGSGYINGTIIGIPRGVKHQDQAWALVRYLTTADHPLAVLSNGLRNVPTTQSSLTSKEIVPDARFSTFLKIFGNAKSGTSPILASGQAYTNAVQRFFQQWQAGKVKDLNAGLTKLAKQLDAQVAQAKGGGGGVP
ncbi:MAG: multiple sugar transport system substrate-binding protein [Gaiellaceae bacterium]|jgi:multiple sugar transport system substrate-binding protein|nr:multiple sugar transport system substrate-binding protein [Gaiellaceae bacterium]